MLCVHVTPCSHYLRLTVLLSQTKQSHYKRLVCRWQTALITHSYRLLRSLLFVFKNTQHSIFFDSLFLLPADREPQTLNTRSAYVYEAGMDSTSRARDATDG